ncbi:hypothetical protein [Candidatus Sarmatiella mevalonica]|uniref:hypothetical protein n=1 Tax=Candidatus Sarmatiella mevalonica TaxID=2770581 RepID=UPI001923DDD9|nr:hypothetical protein [Candidatus Sarmatiella mevalonica]
MRFIITKITSSRNGPHILEYAAVLNIIFSKNSSFIFRLCKRSIISQLKTARRPLFCTLK